MKLCNYLGHDTGKSYVIMFVNGSGQFIGVFVHNTNLRTAAYSMESDTDIGTISFDSSGKATSDKAAEMEKKEDKESTDLPETPDQIKSSGKKINLLRMLVLPSGSYSYFVQDNSENHGSSSFTHSLKYFSKAKFKNQMYIAEAEFNLCTTASKSASCSTASKPELNNLTLSQVTPEGLKRHYEFYGNTYTKLDSKNSPIPLVVDKENPIKVTYTYKYNDVEFTVTFDSYQEKTWAGKKYDYVVLKSTGSSKNRATGKIESRKAQYSWLSKKFGPLGETTTKGKLPGGNEGDKEQYLYVYNSQHESEYGTKPTWLEALGVVEGAPDLIKTAVKDAVAGNVYVPDASQKITIDGKDYLVKRAEVSDKLPSSDGESSSVSINFSFSPADGSQQESKASYFMDISLPDTKYADFRRSLIKANDEGLTKNAAIFASTPGLSLLLTNSNQEVKLTWIKDTNTLTVAGLSGKLHYKYSEYVSIEFGDLIANLTTSNSDY